MKSGGFVPGGPLAVGVLLIYSRLLVNGAQTVGIGNQSARLLGRAGTACRNAWRRLGGSSSGSLGGSRQNRIARRRYFPARNLLMDALQHDQDFFHSPCMPLGET